MRGGLTKFRKRKTRTQFFHRGKERRFYRKTPAFFPNSSSANSDKPQTLKI